MTCAVLGLQNREQPALLGQAGDQDRVGRSAAPAERAGHEHVQVAGAADLHRALDLRLEVAQVGDRGGGHVGDLVGHRDQSHVLALAEGVAALGGAGLGGHRPRRRRGAARALHAGVHVGLVVVTDEQHVVVALEHPRQAGHPDVGRAAVTALADDAHVVAALDPHRGRDPARHRGGVGEQRVQPRHPPRGLGVGRGEDLQAAGRVGGDQLPAARRASRRPARSGHRAPRRSPGRRGDPW